MIQLVFDTDLSTFNSNYLSLLLTLTESIDTGLNDIVVDQIFINGDGTIIFTAYLNANQGQSG